MKNNMKKHLIIQYIKRSRNNVIVLGIMVSVMMIFSLVQIGESIAFRYKNMLLHSFSYDISASSLSEEQYNAVEEFGTEKGFQIVGEDNICSVDVKQYGCPEGLLNSRSSDVNGLEWEAGAMAKKPFELAVDSAFASENDIKPNQEISLNLCFENDEIQEYAFWVTGIYKGSGAGEDLILFYTSPETGEQLMKEGKKTIETARCAYLTLDENSFEAEYLNAMRDELCNIIDPRYEDVVLEDEETLTEEESGLLSHMELCVSLNPIKQEVFQTMSEDRSVFGAIMGVVLILALAMFLLVFNMIHLDSRRRIKDFSMARCIGFDQHHLASLLTWEIAIYILFGCGLGVLAGNVLNYFIAGKIMAAVVGDEVVVIQHWSCYVIALGISILSVLMANIQMIRNVLRIQPIDGLRQLDQSVIIGAKFKKRITKKNYVLQMAMRNISRNRLKSLAVVGSLIVCLTMLNSVVHTFMSIKSMDVGDMYRDTVADCEIHTLEPELEWENVQDACDGVEQIYCYNTQYSMKCNEVENVNIPWNGQVYILDDALFEKLCSSKKELIDLDVKQAQLIYCKLQDYVVEQIENKGRIFTRDNGCNYGVNDCIELVCGVNGTPFEANISAVLDSFNLDFTYADEMENYWIANRAFADAHGLDVAFCNHILFDVEQINSENVSAIKSQYLGENGSFVNFLAEKEENEKQLKGFIVLALYLIVATALTGFISMSNTVKFNILTRRKENAIIRAIGLPFETQIKVICVENLLLILGAVIISSVLAFGVNGLVTAEIMYHFQVHITSYLETAVFAVVVGELTTFATVRKYGNENLEQEIRCSE